MTEAELLALVTGVGVEEDGATRRATLTQISDEIKELYKTNGTLTQTNSQLTADNKQLEDYNRQLYLRVGGQTTQQSHDTTGEDKKPELTYDNLFNEKGELK